jgi:AbrB family looped-hinge helix DNA binding protein
MKVVLREKGRITLPVAIRDALGVSPGDQLEVSAEDEAVVLRPVRVVTSKEMKGILGHTEVDIEETEGALGRDTS